MEKTRDAPERFALGAFAAARRTKKEEGFISHGRNSLYRKLFETGRRKAERKERELFLRQRIDIYPPAGAVEAHVAIDQGKNRVIAPESDVLARQKFRPALAHDNVAGHDQLAAKFFHSQPFADAVATIFDAALSFFVSHFKKLKS